MAHDREYGTGFDGGRNSPAWVISGDNNSDQKLGQLCPSSSKLETLRSSHGWTQQRMAYTLALLKNMAEIFSSAAMASRWVGG